MLCETNYTTHSGSALTGQQKAAVEFQTYELERAAARGSVAAPTAVESGLAIARGLQSPSRVRCAGQLQLPCRWRGR